jgi:hypothetical protein
VGTNSAPVFPYPGGTAGAEAPDPVAGRPGHFAWSRWIKQFVKNLNTNLMAHEDAADPHPNYLNAGRGDVRYYTKAQVDSQVSNLNTTKANVTALTQAEINLTAYTDLQRSEVKAEVKAELKQIVFDSPDFATFQTNVANW